MTDRIIIRNIKSVLDLDVSFKFTESKVLVVTGKNGVGKTTLVQAFRVLEEPDVFKNTSSYISIHENSEILFDIDGYGIFIFSFDKSQKVMDSKDTLPSAGYLVAELPIPFGSRFKHFESLFSRNEEISASNASKRYHDASDLIKFLHDVYGGDKFSGLKAVVVGKKKYYFLPQPKGFYFREDNLSSGEYFLIQIFRIITSGASLIVIDELDVALDASAQVKLFEAIKPLLQEYGSRLIVISHSLAFMNTVDEGALYYLEENQNSITLEQRSFGYVKSDLYGFVGKDRYIITEDEVLLGFLDYLIRNYLVTFFEYEIIPVGGKPQIEMMGKKNDEHEIFGSPDDLVIFIDKDISDKLSYSGTSKVLVSPVDDIELYLWLNRGDLLADVNIKKFTPAEKDKDTAKTYWKKLLRSKKKTKDDLYALVVENNELEAMKLVDELKLHLCLK